MTYGERLEELELFKPGDEMPSGDFVTVFKWLKVGYKEDGARLLSVVTRDKLKQGRYEE